MKRKTEKVQFELSDPYIFFTSSEFDGRYFSKLIINLTQKIDCTLHITHTVNKRREGKKSKTKKIFEQKCIGRLSFIHSFSLSLSKL